MIRSQPFVLWLCCFFATNLAAQVARPLAGSDGRTHRDLAYVVGGHERQKLDLYLPEKTDGPVPLIVWVHGGGWQAGSKENCPPLAAGYVQRGYAVASLNYRLSSHAVFPAQIEDCKAAIRWLRAHAEHYGIDPARIGAWGSSAGGHLAALLGTSGDVGGFDVGQHLDQSSRVQAVCDYFGPTDFIALAKERDADRPASDWSPASKLIGGFVLDHPDKVARANPITYVSADDPPMLIVHGDQDPLVPLGQSELLLAALQKAGVSFRLHVIRGAGHGGRLFQMGEVAGMVSTFFDRSLDLKSAQLSAVGAATNTTPAAAATVLKGFKFAGERWTYRDGDFEMNGILLKPPGKGPFPAVLISHGLGGSADSFGLQKAREMVQWGMVCLAPDYTHNRNGADRATFGASAENLRRAMTCLELLRQMPEVDPERLACYGHSMGGFVTIGLAAARPEGLRCAAITGSGIAPREGFAAPSSAQASKIRTPFLMLHGANDTTVRPEMSADLKRVLDGNGVLTDRLIADGQGHPIDQTMRAEVFRLIRDWFQKNGVLLSR